eukprot:scaffold122462_cov83-Cyclotella_meneghiniana.AAC.1
MVFKTTTDHRGIKSIWTQVKLALLQKNYRDQWAPTGAHSWKAVIRNPAITFRGRFSPTRLPLNSVITCAGGWPLSAVKSSQWTAKVGNEHRTKIQVGTLTSRSSMIKLKPASVSSAQATCKFAKYRHYIELHDKAQSQSLVTPHISPSIGIVNTPDCAGYYLWSGISAVNPCTLPLPLPMVLFLLGY